MGSKQLLAVLGRPSGRWTGVLLAVVLGLLTTRAHATPIVFIGSLDTTGGGLTAVAGSDYDLGGVTFSWEVSQADPASLWHYSYTIEAPKTLSHLLLEVSSTFTASNYLNGDHALASGDPRTYTSGGSNPQLPGPLFAIKLSGSSTLETLTFDSPRAPVWADFYAKDGNNDPTNAVWNTGFLDADPVAAPASGSVDNHILAPDTSTTILEVPEPASLSLLGLGVLALVRRRRK